MKFNQFITKPEYYETNNYDASHLHTIPATITPPTGGQEPGVVVLVGHRVKLAMNHSQALGLANGIADALAASRNQHPVHQDRTTQNTESELAK